MKKISLYLIFLIISFISITCELKDGDPVSPGTGDDEDITISILSPVSGDTLIAASEWEIQWTSNTSSDVKIEFTTNNALSWETIVSSTENDGNFLWKPIPNRVSSQCRIRITTLDTLGISQISNDFFRIAENPQKAVTIVKPNGGEVLIIGDDTVIEWVSSNIRNLRIDYSVDNRTTWYNLTPSYPADSGKYLWESIPDLPSSRCYLRLIDVAADSITDISDAPFTITALQQTLRITSPNGGEVFKINSETDIEWFSSAVVAVKLEYTTNNGVDWFTIADNIESTGFYRWNPIPGNPSTNAKVRITDNSDGFPSDMSDETFSIQPETDLVVTAPSGNEQWRSGSSEVIRWSFDATNSPVKKNADDTVVSEVRNRNSKKKTTIGNNINNLEGVENVKIEYTTNNGSVWYTIVSETPNIGEYLWENIPSHNSSLCRVRISDATDGLPFALSEETFTIYNTTEQAINLINPNGGQEILNTEPYDIIWESTEIEAVSIEYTTNNGVNWATIISSTPSNGKYTWSSIPTVSAANCKIRIKDASDGIPEDVSEKVFSIKEEKNITVASPNGGEKWFSGSSQTISWRANDIALVKIEYTSNGGANWTFLVDSLQNNGTYNWTNIPTLNSALCKIRISEVGNSNVYDMSDAFFSVYESDPETITLTAPNGGEILDAGGSYVINWNALGISNVKLEYSTNNGVSWNVISTSTPSDGSYTWNPIPEISGANCRVRVSDAADGAPSDISDEPFTILPKPTLTLLLPNGGEELLSGSTYFIKWGYQGEGSVKQNNEVISNKKTSLRDINEIMEEVDFITIELSTDNGISWAMVADSVSNNGTYRWDNVPTITSSLCKIKITAVDRDEPYDISDAAFTITNSQQQTITITYPTSGASLSAGESAEITWNSTNVTAVDIAYSTNNGINWTNIVINTPSDGYYLWNQIPNVPSTNCKIRVADSEDGNPQVLNNGFFLIISEPSVSVSAPNGGESLLSGSSFEIEWESENIEDVKIEFTTNNGANWTTIVESTPSIGSFTWQSIPSLNSKLCKIKVSDAENGSPSDISDASFEIYNQVVQTITLLSPVGLEEWEAGTSQTISWNSTNIPNITLEYTTNNGQNWNAIASNYTNTGFYEWSVPDVSSNQCKVRVFDAVDSLPIATSNNPFSIKPTASLTVTQPNGGEEIIAGEPYAIQWNSTGVKNVKIEFTTNNGLFEEDWNQLVASTPSDGEYIASFSVLSNLCKVRISDAENGYPIDESDGTFKVSEAPSITVTSPNGGESWLAGTINEITWVSNNIANVDIEYTLDNGANWKTIVENIQSNGIYNWTIPVGIDFRSDLCKIRISDASDGTPSDQSDEVFSIHPKEKLLRLVTPNGGEEWTQNTTERIEWTSAGINEVRIEYTLDNGEHWIEIIDRTPSYGAYMWTIPDEVSSLCRIRIFDADDATYSDMSDDFFNILDDGQ